MGTTAAMLMCGPKDIFICNVGDSRIYHYVKKNMTQISHDHSAVGITGRKPPLTQNLGIPDTEFVIEPHAAKRAYNNGDRYLICSDGLTDMVSDDEITEIMGSRGNIRDTAQKLMERALERGGIDNITLILCEVHRQNRFGRSKIFTPTRDI